MKLLYQAWSTNGLFEWSMALIILLGVLTWLTLLRYGAVRVLAMLARKTAAPPAVIAMQVLGATRLWLLFPVALYAGASAVELPNKLEHLIEVIVVVGLLLQAGLWINRLVACWLEHQIEFAYPTQTVYVQRSDTLSPSAAG
ncbi:MAG: hypothetical protein ACREPG_08440 [Candidatus Binatia bacterium]